MTNTPIIDTETLHGKPPRTRPDAGRLRPADRPAGDNGRPTCRLCARPVGKRRRTFCSDNCSHEWRLRTSPSYVRRMLYRRDRGRCATCGMHTASLRARWNKLPAEDRAAAEKAFGLHSRRHSMWDADHFLPVALGGGQCGLDGYRTLCIPCHKAATAALREQLRALKAD